MRHTRYGYWLEEAGPVEPTEPLAGDTTADVVVIGAGYLGLWTALQLKALEPGIDVVVLERGLAGHGPSGRNGGFVSTLWDDLPILRETFGDTRAVAVCKASERGVHSIAAWCDAEGVDAWFRPAPTLYVATSDAQVGDWDELVAACEAVGEPGEARPLTEDEVSARCASPLFRGGGLMLADGGDRPSGPALPGAACQGNRIRHPPARADARHPDRGSARVVTTSGHTVNAAAVVLAVNSATPSFCGYRLAVGVASSHMVITEPVPDVLEEIGWTGGEAIADCRTLLHYLRTTRDGRIALGWGGGRMGIGGRHSEILDLDRNAVATAKADLLRMFPQLHDRRVTHAWGGPIDVSPTHLPIFGSRGRLHHGFGFTGNGVGPSYLGGEILARLALDRRDELTRLAIVDPDRKLMPPEPLRWLGGSAIRAALVRRDAAYDRGLQPDPVTGFVASLPRRLGLHLPR